MEKILESVGSMETGWETWTLQMRCCPVGKLAWLGHVWCMGKNRRANQILHRVPERRKRRGRPRKNWAETVKNLRGLKISWEKAEGLAMDSQVENMHYPMCIIIIIIF